MPPTTAAGLPPGPRLPALAQTLGFLVAPRRFISGVHRRYGPMATLRTSFDPGFVMVFDPELVRALFRGPPERLRAGEANSLLGPLLGEHSVLLLDGAEHLRQRRLLLPPFHGERMRSYEAAIRAASDRAIDGWPAGEPFPLMASTQSLTLEVIMRAIFGMDEGTRERELRETIRSALEPVATRLGVLVLALSGGRFGQRGAMRRFAERRAHLDRLIHDEIGRRREAGDLERREDVMSMLLLARDEDGRAMSDAELRDELVTMLVAGHETTAIGLAWMFDLVLRTPHVLARTREALAAGDERWLDAVVRETLRIRPVIPGVGRVVRGGPFELGGRSIPDGMEINPSIAAIHMRADIYPSPEEFRPERFLGDDAPDTYSWLPFGGGTRRCLGASFALFEMRAVLRRVLERCELEPAGRRPARAERRGITVAPAGGVRVRLRSRRPATPAPSPGAALTPSADRS